MQPTQPIDPIVHPLLQPLEGWILENQALAAVLIALGVLVVGELLHRIFRRYVLRFLQYLAEQSPVDWDRVLFRVGMPQRLAWGVPILVWQAGLPLIPGLPEEHASLVRRIFLAALVVVLVRAFDALLKGVNEIYQGLPRAQERPIKGFLQVANVVAHLAAIILVVAVLMDRSPLLFLSGLGAMTAVLLLVFRDTLLSLVAGIQITTNDLIRVGDWIEMPQFSADGDVVDIALNSITVQNWDRTYSVVPTHKFLEHSFRNWRGMVASGGRRIKRSFHLDVSTIRFLTDEEVERFRRWELLADYIDEKTAELEAHNREHPAGEGIEVANRRRLTNVGTLRAYLSQYLKQHPGLRHDMIMMVRQLEPEPDGLPLEIYAFGADTRWPVYEGVQADIFDHVLSIVPEFGLRVFQEPSGADLQRAVARLGARAVGAEGRAGSEDALAVAAARAEQPAGAGRPALSSGRGESGRGGKGPAPSPGAGRAAASDEAAVGAPGGTAEAAEANGGPSSGERS